MAKKDMKDSVSTEEEALKQAESIGANTKEEPEETSVKDNDRLKEELEKEKERSLRLFAEFENYKKRTNKERMELYKTAGQEVIQSLLPVLDDFDRAIAELQKAEEDSLLKGIVLIHNKMKETLKNKGLAVLEVKKGDPFNPDNHEAITQVPAPSEDMKGKIIDVVEKGYLLGDKILRYPKVVIGQ